MSETAIQTVLCSVTDKTGLVELMQGLKRLYEGLRIIASGGTAACLEQGGLSVTSVEEYTGAPECFSGRVKTLHPKIAGGILHRRPEDSDEAKELGILGIDLLVCNLYDFEKALEDESQVMDDLVEKMDIGGSTLIRSAVKNYRSVSVLVDPNDYTEFLANVQEGRGYITVDMRAGLAAKAINYSADYEALLATEFSSRLMDEQTLRQKLTSGRALRYGENPDQSAWVFSNDKQDGLAQAKVLSGKELSFNNYEDATVAYHAAQEILGVCDHHGVAIVKHGSLCAYASGDSSADAFERAWWGDSKSAFGSVIAFTHILDEGMIPVLSKRFVELLIAPAFSESLLLWVKEKKPNLRLLQVPPSRQAKMLYKTISGGMLVQTAKKQQVLDSVENLLNRCEDLQEKRGVVSKAQPSHVSLGLLQFGISAVKFAKSNAVVVVREAVPGGFQVIGVGAGQPNRVDSLERLALPKAVENLKSEFPDADEEKIREEMGKCVLVSDGFFPFADSIEVAYELGIRCCVQPGGSMRDTEVVAAADTFEMCMIFTGERYFTH